MDISKAALPDTGRYAISSVRQNLCQVPPAGIEQKPFSPRRVQVSETAGAKSGAVDRENAPITPDLETVIEAWHTLPPAIREAILAMLRAAE